jgi:molybdopterin/thiamine biosynthesis adenylyltransferase/nitroreductase
VTAIFEHVLDPNWAPRTSNGIEPLQLRPALFYPDRKDDKEKLWRLVDNRPDVQICDPLAAQLKELIKTRNPARVFCAEELAQLSTAHIGGRPWHEYGVWVYYSWSNRLVHLLDEPEFVELRTNRNCYKITREEQTRLSHARIGIIGLSAGHSIALTLALERSFGELRLADFDSLDLSNLNRIRTGVHNLGINKAILTAREIAELDPFLNVRCFADGIQAETLDRFLLEGGPLDLIVDECDGIDMKFLLRERAKALQIPVLMQTSDRGQLDVERFDLEPGRPIFHGLAGDIGYHSLQGLSTFEKVPHVLNILGVATISKRLKASLIEIEQTISTWPQLGSAVVLGGGVAADACRRIYLNQFRGSGRYYIDLEALVGVGEKVPDPKITAAAPPSFATLPGGDLITKNFAQREGLLLGREQIEQLVRAGNQAPSGGNCQPWRWICESGCLYLFHDKGRSESFLDYQDCASMVALGAAAENILLCAPAIGLSAEIQPFPLASKPSLVARFCFRQRGGAELEANDKWEHLAGEIFARHTNRRFGVRQPLPPNSIAALREAAESIAGGGFDVLQTDEQLAEIESVLAPAERLRLLHQTCHRDLVREIRWTPQEAEQTCDGIDLATMDLTPSDQAALQVCRDWATLDLVRQWGGGKALEKMTRKAIKGASAVGLITVPGHRREDYFRGGRAMQRIWLTAQRLGLALQPQSALLYLFARLIRGQGEGLQPEFQAELRQLRQRFERLFPVSNDAAEILLFRLAVADPPTAYSLRRPVAQTLTLIHRNGHGPKTH